MRLLPAVLLRHDPRVQRAYELWRVRAIGYEEAGQFTLAAALQSLFEDSVQLNALVRELNLERYQSWLPVMLRWEFQRQIEGAPTVDVTVPEGASWAAAGRAPKHGETHHENLERNITWFYCHRVKSPSDSKYAIEQDYIRERSREGVSVLTGKRQVKHGIKRAEQLLACIDAPMPPE